jgi:hypothetical protein
MDLIAIVLIVWACWWYVDANQGGDSTGLGSDFVSLWAQAIATAENVNPAYNNPGGLNEAGDAGSTPATGGGVIGIFSSLQAGFAALTSTLSGYASKYGNLSLLDTTAIYVLGPSGAAAAAGNYPANVVNEAEIVANQLGVSINTTIDDLEGAK